jgi:tRNA A-37 threonylcarbamoyl transferase component Bud32
MIVDTPALATIMENQQTLLHTAYERVLWEERNGKERNGKERNGKERNGKERNEEPLFTPIVRIKNPKGLSVFVTISEKEHDKCYKKALYNCEKDHEKLSKDYYKSYLRRLHEDLGEDHYENILQKLDKLRKQVSYKMNQCEFMEEMFVRGVLKGNKYISKNTRRSGLIVKLFHSFFEGREVIVKTYLYDPGYVSLRHSIERNFENEAVFQLYAEDLRGKLDFISPELYSWGQIRHYSITEDGHKFQCLFLIMKYISGLTLKEASYSTENMKKIYEKVNKMNMRLNGELLHHNDLHSGNIMVVEHPRSPEPEIVLIDFSESSLGPTIPLYC